MEMLSRLKSTVTQALPGNPITRDYEVNTHRASAGPGLFWKVYDGITRSSKQEVSIFMFEKKQIDRYSRRDKDIIVDTLKKGVAQLTRLRHPKILSVLHPLEESRDSLAFATEPVFASLANVLGNHDNLPNPVPPEIKDHQLYDVEIKYGLLQVSEGLTFLHNDVKLVHSNICPQSIVLNKSGAWKIAGFDFCIRNANTTDQAPYYPFSEWNMDIPPCVQPHLDYLSPEHTLSHTCDTSSDMYSLGVLFYAVFNGGKPLFECNNQLATYKKNIEELRNLKKSILLAIPDEVRDHVKLLLNTEPTVRPDADQLSKIPFFEDVGAMTLQYLDSLMQRDNLQKSQFFKGLPQVIAKMPKRVGLQRILPCIMKECMNKDMVPFILPSIIVLSEQATEREFARLILPGLIPIFKIQEPVQVMLIFLQNMNLLLQKTPQNDIKNHVLPMVYRALEANTPQIQELTLSILPTFASLLDYTSMKNAIVPRIKKLCLSTGTLSIRVNCLVCLGQLLEYMDKWYVQDEIFPILQAIPSREPAVLMSCLGIFKVALSHDKLGISKDVMASKVLPFLIPLSIDNNLNLGQFNAFMSIIHEMINKVESEHKAKLEQLDSLQQEQRSLQFTKESVQDASALVPGISSAPKQETMMDKFMSGFGFGSMATSASSKPPDSGQSLSTNVNTSPKKDPAKFMGQASKVNLSLEEKQRLAQQQEQQKLFKSQQPLTSPTSNNTKTTLQPKPAATTPNKPQVKDLTSTLMNSNLNSMNSAPKKPVSTFSSSNGTFSTPGFSSGSTMSSMASNSSGFSSGTSGTFGQSGMSGMNTGFGMSGGSKAQAQGSMDMSSLDSLLPSKPKPSLNQLQQPQQTMAPGMGMQQGMMGNNMGMMGMQQGMMGPPRMMGNPRMMGMQQPMGMQPMVPQQNMMFGQQSMNNSQSAKNDFDTLFG